MSTPLAAYRATDHTALFGLNALFSRFFKPSWVGMLCCILSFVAASVALAYSASLFQAPSSTVKLRTTDQVQRYQLDSGAILSLQPQTRVNVVNYDTVQELHVLGGEVQVNLQTVAADIKTRVYAGKKVIESQDGVISVTHQVHTTPSIHISSGTVRVANEQVWWQSNQ